MARKLVVDQGAMLAIAGDVGCTAKHVSMALKGAVASELSRKVRALAIVKYKARVSRESELTPEERLEELGMEGEYGYRRE